MCSGGYFLKDLLSIAKRRRPVPRRSRLIGHGMVQPTTGRVFMPANRSSEPMISKALPTIISHFDATNMIHLRCYYSTM
jgi:hypothetical protein